MEDLNAIMPCGHRRRFESIIEGGHSPVCQMCQVAKLQAALESIAGYDAAEESGMSYNEWVGEAAYGKVQQLAREALRRK